MLIAFFATLVFVGLVVLKQWFHQCRVKKATRVLQTHHGCLPAPRLHNNIIFGFDRIGQLFRADVELRLMETLAFHFRQTGNTFEHVLLGSSGFATIEPANIAALLTYKEDFGIEPRRNVLQPIFGDGIFTQEGLDWERSRNTIRGQLQHRQYGNLELFQGSVDDLIHTVEKGGGMVDLQPLFFRMTLDTTTEFLFGESVRSLVAPEDSIGRRFANAFDVVQRRATGQMRRCDILWLGDRQRYRQAWTDLTRITDQILDRNIKLSKQNCNPTKRQEFLCAMAQTASDPAALRGQVLNLLAAGRDTTASLLSWTFFLLVRHPHVMKKLRAEIASVCEIDDVLSRKTLRKMFFLQRILKEALRLYPSVPLNLRTALRDTMLPVGGGPDGKTPIPIPKGKTFVFCPYALHRRPDLYGMDATSFRPERWEEDMPLLFDSVNNKWGYIPFGAGPRTCLGMDFALTEAAYTIVRLLQRFSCIKLPESEILEPTGVEKQVLTLILSIDQGCKVTTL